MRRTPAALVLLLALASSIIHPATGSSAGPAESIAIVSLEISGDGAPELRTQLQRSLGAGLATAGARVIPLDEVQSRLVDSPELIGCVSTTCLARIGEMVGAGKFVRARVEATGAEYLVELELLSARVDGAVIGRLRESCSVCTITEVNELVSETASQLLSVGQRKEAPVVIESRPPGARLSIGGRDVGVAPFSGSLPPGTHEILATLDGMALSERSIEVRGDSAEVERFEIVLAPATPPAETTRPYRTWKWAAAGGGAAALVTGSVLIALDGTCDRPEGRQCRQVRDTMVTGILGVGAGLGLGGLSTWMFFRDRAGKESAATITPIAGGALATVLLRF